jgi:hypothetical protein
MQGKLRGWIWSVGKELPGILQEDFGFGEGGLVSTIMSSWGGCRCET